MHGFSKILSLLRSLSLPLLHNNSLEKKNVCAGSLTFLLHLHQIPLLKYLFRASVSQPWALRFATRMTTSAIFLIWSRILRKSFFAPQKFHFWNTKITPPYPTPPEFPQVLFSTPIPSGKNSFDSFGRKVCLRLTLQTLSCLHCMSPLFYILDLS